MSDCSEPFWKNPCGLDNVDDDNQDEVDLLPVNDEEKREILEDVISRTRICNQQARAIKTYMLEELLNLDEASLNEQKYDWLQSPEEDAETFSRQDTLKEVYYLLQKFAIAFEQISNDQEDIPAFEEHLKTCNNNLRQLFCSFQLALNVLNIKHYPDATSDIMNDELRTLEGAVKLVRDFLIVRDYVKAVDFVEILIEHLLINLT